MGQTKPFAGQGQALYVVPVNPKQSFLSETESMKTFVRHFAFLALIGLILSPLALAHASPSTADSVHFCTPFDHEQWRRDHPLPAGKQLAALNIGPPRTVRLIYFLPKDLPINEDSVESMKVQIMQLQTFFAEQMQAHGFGNTTFRIETDAEGQPLVHNVFGQHHEGYYNNDVNYYNVTGAVFDEISQKFNLRENIYFISVDNSSGALGRGGGRNVGGVGGQRGKSGGYSLSPLKASFGTRAHELGHAFGLRHDFNNDAYIMSYGWERDGLSACNAEFLAVHPYFNSDSPTSIRKSALPTIELISPLIYSTSSARMDIQFEVGSSRGLHQALLFVRTRPPHFAAGFLEVKSCRGLASEQQAHVEFDYDGIIPSSDFSSLSDPVVHPLRVKISNREGDVTDKELMFAEMSPYQIATLEGHTGRVRSVSFSPDGTLLASGSDDVSIKLWDVAKRQNIATLEGHTGRVRSVSFSPDGTLLASGSDDVSIKLWDVASRQNITTLTEENSDRASFLSVSFSPDGTLLASGSWGTVLLWDVAKRQNVASLKGHRDWVRSVSFSPDGTLLASGSDDVSIKLWDVAKRQNITTLRGIRNYRNSVLSVSFSPDGKTLASGSGDRTVELWDGEVATRRNLATLEGHTGWVNSVSFSPNGTLLASSSADGTVKLWDVAKRQNVANFGNTSQVQSVSFSSDQTILASGLEDGTIALWDVSEWMEPSKQKQRVTSDEQAQPETLTATDTEQTAHSLTKASGDNQEGPAGTQLAAPFVVSVLDQDGEAFAGASVTFSVTAGEGMLSSATDANPCTIESSTSSTTVTTDANGRAATRLTLGSEPGTNTVRATVAGLEPVTFTATAAEQAIPHRLTKVCGDDQEGIVGILLAEPFVVSVMDEDDAAMAGVVVSFAVTAGGGALSSATATTDANGRAATSLTLGSEVGTNTVEATVAGLASVTFTATGQEDPLASLFGTFGGGKLVALPDRTQLLQNAPNPFNSQTVLSYFLLAPGPVRLEVFALSGQRVAVLHQGPQQAGYHRLYWDGRDDVGYSVASGAYLYRLVTSEGILTRKLILLR